MASRLPLVIASGRIQQLQAGDRLQRGVDYVSVYDHGAVGDGATDDTAAFSAAALAAGAGGCVVIPDGTFRLTAEISNLAAGQLWLGLGGTITTDNGFNHHIFNPIGLVDFTIHGVKANAGTLGAAYSVATARFARFTASADRGRVLFCTTDGFQSAVQFNDSDDGLVLGCTILNPEGWGVNVQRSCNDTVVAFNTVRGVVNEHGIYVSNAANETIERTVILGNLVSDVGINCVKLLGIATTGPVTDTVISNNILTSDSGFATIFNTVNCTRTVIDGNFVSAVDSIAIQVFDTCNNTIVINNIIEIETTMVGTVSDGVNINDTCTQCMISDNQTIGDADSRYGIIITNDCDSNTISDNYVDGFDDGIRINDSTCDANLIIDNFVRNISGTRINDAGTDTIVVDVPTASGESFVYNEGGNDFDFRVEGATATHALVVDAGLDAVQIGTTSAGTIADFRAASITLNELGADSDFRLEGDSLTHMIFTDASATTENIALVATGAPNWQTMDRGLFIGDASTAPTGNPTAGFFMYSNSGAPTFRSSGGVITDLSLVTSGVYTPTASSATNLDATPTMTQAQYMRVGNVVTVSGRFTADPTAGGAADFEIDLPVASNLGAAEDLSGVAFSGAIAGQGAEIIGVVANDTAQIQWVAVDTTSQLWSYTFTYRMI